MSISIEDEEIVYTGRSLEIKYLIPNEETIEVKPDSAAERMYKNHKANVKKYQQKNPEKMKEKAKRYMDKLKLDKPRYAKYLEQKRTLYKNKKNKNNPIDN